DLSERVGGLPDSAAARGGDFQIVLAEQSGESAELRAVGADVEVGDGDSAVVWRRVGCDRRQPPLVDNSGDCRGGTSNGRVGDSVDPPTIGQRVHRVRPPALVVIDDCAGTVGTDPFGAAGAAGGDDIGAA